MLSLTRHYQSVSATSSSGTANNNEQEEGYRRRHLNSFSSITSASTTSNENHVVFDLSRNICWKLPSKKYLKKQLNQLKQQQKEQQNDLSHALAMDMTINNDVRIRINSSSSNSSLPNNERKGDKEVKGILKVPRNPHFDQELLNIKTKKTVFLRMSEKEARKCEELYSDSEEILSSSPTSINCPHLSDSSELECSFIDDECEEDLTDEYLMNQILMKRSLNHKVLASVGETAEENETEQNGQSCIFSSNNVNSSINSNNGNAKRKQKKKKKNGNNKRKH